MGPCTHCGTKTDRAFLWDGFDPYTGKATHGYGFDCGCMDPKPTIFGRSLYRWRVDQRISVRDMAEKAGLSPGDLSGIEHGRIVLTDEKADRLARRLGMDS